MMVFASGGGEWRLGRCMRELSEGDGNVPYFDRGLGYAGACFCQNSVNVHVRYVHILVCKFCIRKKHK